MAHSPSRNQNSQWNLIAPIWTVIKFMESLFYRLRNFLWSYPDFLLFDQNSVAKLGGRLYQISRPYSHFSLAATIILVSLLAIWAAAILPPVTAFGRTRLVEGVVMGVTAEGRLQSLSKVNPLIPSSIQLERDLNELIYEPLLRYEQDGSISRVLAKDILRIQEGAIYEFTLRDDVRWHNGQRLTVSDVLATLEVIKALDIESKPDLANAYIRAIKQMDWLRTGDDSFIICATNDALRKTLADQGETNPCTLGLGERPIISNLLEFLTIKIMPENSLRDVNTVTIDTTTPYINRFPIGTGKYKFVRAEANSILVTKNEIYYGDIPHIDEIEFKLFTTEDSAVTALQNGELHSLVSVSTQNLRSVKNYNHLTTLKSPVLRNQYWAIYFNLRKDPSGKALGPEFLQDVKVREALSYTIDKQRIITTLLDTGEVSKGPMYPGSYYYNSKVSWPDFNPVRAAQLLDEAGWKVNNVNGIREKNGVKMSFSMAFADNPDREKIVESIRLDLLEIGVELIAEPKPQRDLLEQNVLPRLYDSLLFGIATFIDPDRYELFHSKEEFLNLSSYVGSAQTVKIEGGKTVDLPKIDRLLEVGRSLDPEAKAKRKETYDELQQLIRNDAPVIFLYHPQFIYYHHQRLQSVTIDTAGNLEERFAKVEEWRLD